MKRYPPGLIRTVNRLEGFLEREHMLGEGDRIIAGVSGGADSVCLLYLLHTFLSERLGLSLRVVHVHHGLRDAADGDAAFVEELCGEWKIPCAVRYADVRGLCRREGLGEEEAARILRYGIFEEEAASWDAKIALAHNLDDQAETVLHNLARGSSLKGLGGMAPVNGRLIRPLLIFSRAEIEEVLSAAGLSHREDESNQTDVYTRNRLRHSVLPVLEEKVNGNAAAHIAQAARDIAEADALLDALADKLEEEAALPAKEGEILALRVRTLTQAPAVLAKRLLHRAIARAGGSARDVGRIHVDDVYAICEGGKNARIDLPGRAAAVRESGRLFFINAER